MSTQERVLCAMYSRVCIKNVQLCVRPQRSLLACGGRTLRGWGQDGQLFFLALPFLHFEFRITSIIDAKINFREHGISYNGIL